MNTVTDDVMATIQRFNEERIKSNEEIGKAIRELTKAVENLAAQTNNQAKNASHESVGAPQPRYQRARRPMNESVVCYHCIQPGKLQ